MHKSITIHCVDDDPVNRLMLQDALSDYDCLLLDSGLACLDAARESAPDLILLDVEMPGMGGLDTCTRLRALSELGHIPILFLSAHTSLEARLDGYAAGGDDYIGKPFARDELQAKVKAALKRKEHYDAAHQQAREASVTVTDIMNAMGEMSAVVNFFQATFACRSYDMLAQKIIQAHNTLGLEIAVEFIIDDTRLSYSSDGINTPLEESVFEYVRTKGRLVNCGQRAAVNYPYITLLIRNMPSDNPDLAGRIRDHIALIAQAADAKIKTLRAELLLKRQHEQLIAIVGEMQQAVTEINRDYQQQQQLSEHIFTALEDTLEDSFMSLGLTEQQEQDLRGVTAAAHSQSRQLYEAGLALEERFAQILGKIEQTLAMSANEGDEMVEDDAIDGEAVSLF